MEYFPNLGVSIGDTITITQKFGIFASEKVYGVVFSIYLIHMIFGVSVWFLAY